MKKVRQDLTLLNTMQLNIYSVLKKQLLHETRYATFLVDSHSECE